MEGRHGRTSPSFSPPPSHMQTLQQLDIFCALRISSSTRASQHACPWQALPPTICQSICMSSRLFLHFLSLAVSSEPYPSLIPYYCMHTYPGSSAPFRFCLSTSLSIGIVLNFMLVVLLPGGSLVVGILFRVMEGRVHDVSVTWRRQEEQDGWMVGMAVRAVTVTWRVGGWYERSCFLSHAIFSLCRRILLSTNTALLPLPSSCPPTLCRRMAVGSLVLHASPPPAYGLFRYGLDCVPLNKRKLLLFGWFGAVFMRRLSGFLPVLPCVPLRHFLAYYLHIRGSYAVLSAVPNTPSPSLQPATICRHRARCVHSRARI